MDHQDLRTFVAVADARSFSRAASILHLSQPAVSKRIQALEDSLNARLFDRVGKQVLLTQAGRVLLPQANQIIAMFSDTERQIRNLSKRIGGSLHLATSHHIGLHRLEPVLEAFIARFGDVKLNISFEDSEVAHDLLHRGEIELAVVTLNPVGDASLAYQPIWHDPLQFVNATPLPGVKTLQDLAALPAVLPGSATYTGRIVMQRFADQGVPLTPSMSTNYLETIGMLVGVGLGWSVLPRSMSEGLHTLEIDCEPMSRTLGCVTNPQRAMSNAAGAFMQVLQGFADLPDSTG